MATLLRVLARPVAQLPRDVQRVHVEFSKMGAGSSGARHFVREFFPSLRWNNPDVVCEWNRHNNTTLASAVDASMTVLSQARGEIKVPVKNLTADEIHRKLAEIASGASQ